MVVMGASSGGSLARKSAKYDSLRPRFLETAEAAARDAALLREILERI